MTNELEAALKWIGTQSAYSVTSDIYLDNSIVYRGKGKTYEELVLIAYKHHCACKIWPTTQHCANCQKLQEQLEAAQKALADALEWKEQYRSQSERFAKEVQALQKELAEEKAKIPCPDCSGTGRRICMAQNTYYTCSECSGTGRREV